MKKIYRFFLIKKITKFYKTCLVFSSRLTNLLHSKITKKKLYLIFTQESYRNLKYLKNIY